MLDGLPAIFGAALAPLYADGVLHKQVFTDDGAGGFAASGADWPIKVLIEGMDEKDRVTSGLPINSSTATVLRAGLQVPIDVDDTFTVAGATYRIVSAAIDAAQTSVAITAVPA